MSQFYGKIKVSMTKTELFADYTIRHFLLERVSGKGHLDE